MVSHTSAPRQNRRIRNGNAQGTAITRLVPVAFQQVPGHHVGVMT